MKKQAQKDVKNVKQVIVTEKESLVDTTLKTFLKSLIGESESNKIY